MSADLFRISTNILAEGRIFTENPQIFSGEYSGFQNYFGKPVATVKRIRLSVPK